MLELLLKQVIIIKVEPKIVKQIYSYILLYNFLTINPPILKINIYEIKVNKL